MIPVTPQSEPVNFLQQVRIPGQKFLKTVSNPTNEQWKGKEYWQKALPEMRSAYSRICAYCAQWIPHSTGGHAIDHFIPKSLQPSLAYEWSNFRYVSSRFNSRKGTKIILDPFQLQKDWFVLDFSTFLIKPNSKLSLDQQRLVLETIYTLKLNSDEDLVIERQTWVEEFRKGEIIFEYLKKRAPFIAYELERQGILSKL